MAIWVDAFHKQKVVLPESMDFTKTIGIVWYWEYDDQVSQLMDVLTGHENEYGTWEFDLHEKAIFIDPESSLYADLKLRCKNIFNHGHEPFCKLDDNNEMVYLLSHEHPKTIREYRLKVPFFHVEF